jgi:flagellar motor switch protein FliN
MRHAESDSWVARLEAEIARELGQPIAMRAGGTLPDPATGLVHRLQIPGGHLVLAAAREDLAGLMVEARLIEAAQADIATLGELWTGILTSVSARLGGSIGTTEQHASVPMEPCILQLGSATMRMGLAVETGERIEGKGSTGGNYDLLLEVELDAVVRFGSRDIELGELLELGPGDVVELDRQVSDPVDLIVGDKIIARGEVVLVNGNFGLRVTEIAEPIRRLESIRCLC